MRFVLVVIAFTANEPPSYISRLLSPENLPNIALVVVGILGIITAVCTLIIIKKQTEAAVKAANAALMSAQVVINAERAWIVVEMHPVYRRDEHGYWFSEDGVQLTTKEILAGEHLAYSLRIRNVGRTPAQILSYQFVYSCLPEGFKDIPPHSDGDISQTGVFNHLLPNGSGPIEILPPFDIGTYMTDSRTEIEDLKKTAVFHGWVKYRHMFSTDECQSDYCYVYRPSLKKSMAVGRRTKYT